MMTTHHGSSGDKPKDPISVANEFHRPASASDQVLRAFVDGDWETVDRLFAVMSDVDVQVVAERILKLNNSMFSSPLFQRMISPASWGEQ